MTSGKVLIIGGGPSGLESARCVAELGGEAILIEKRERLGGTPDRENYAKLTHHWRDASEAMAEMAAAVTGNPNVEVKYQAEVKSVSGSAGDFTVEIEAGGVAESLNVGAVIIATGFQHFDPGRATQYYNYYSFPDVITLTDLEKMLREHNVVRPSNGEAPKKIAFVQCVGSRDRQIGNEYCSKVCCGIASKQAIELRQQIPDSKVFIFYIDMRMYGYWENEIYWPAQEKYHVNYVKGAWSQARARVPLRNCWAFNKINMASSKQAALVDWILLQPLRRASSLRVQRPALLTSMTPFQRQVSPPRVHLHPFVK